MRSSKRAAPLYSCKRWAPLYSSRREELLPLIGRQGQAGGLVGQGLCVQHSFFCIFCRPEVETQNTGLFFHCRSSFLLYFKAHKALYLVQEEIGIFQRRRGGPNVLTQPKPERLTFCEERKKCFQ